MSEKTTKKNNPIILAVETSCDETAAAVVQGGRDILSNVVLSQVDSHKRFGGVVPEVASRHHVEQITWTMERALEDAKLTLDDLDAIAVTEGPGLVGALLVGVNAAKAIAYAKNIPLINVHHIAGHIYANQLVEELTFPLLALVVSGGHTELIYMEDDGKFQVIGETRDDAVGEAFDKVARTLGLPYPGGPHIDKLAANGKATIDFPRAWLERDSFDFSFSGLKSAVINKLHNAEQRNETLVIEDVAASFQQSVIDVLVEKSYQAAKQYSVRQMIVAGGVAANRGLRQAMAERFNGSGIPLSIPPLQLCTDNAAMIGAAAYVKWKRQQFANWTLNGEPSLDIESW